MYHKYQFECNKIIYININKNLLKIIFIKSFLDLIFWVVLSFICHAMAKTIPYGQIINLWFIIYNLRIAESENQNRWRMEIKH